MKKLLKLAASIVIAAAFVALFIGAMYLVFVYVQPFIARHVGSATAIIYLIMAALFVTLVREIYLGLK